MGRAEPGQRYLTARVGPRWKRFLLAGRSPSAYLVAACIILAAVGVRTVLEAFVPGMPRFMVLFPAIVFVGLFCGTAAGAGIKKQQKVLEPELIAAMLRRLDPARRQQALRGLELLAEAATEMIASGELQRILKGGAA